MVSHPFHLQLLSFLISYVGTSLANFNYESTSNYPFMDLGIFLTGDEMELVLQLLKAGSPTNKTFFYDLNTKVMTTIANHLVQQSQLWHYT